MLLVLALYAYLRHAVLGCVDTHDRSCAPQSRVTAYTCAYGTSPPDSGLVGRCCRMVALRATRWLSGVAVWWGCRIAARSAARCGYVVACCLLLWCVLLAWEWGGNVAIGSICERSWLGYVGGVWWWRAPEVARMLVTAD